MITVFNRKEVLITTNAEIYSNAKDDLKRAKIDFTLGSKGNNFKHATARMRTGMPAGAKYVNTGMIYIIYVHEKDYGKAIKVINEGKHNGR